MMPIIIVGLLGLIVGSFLNVVIYRLPHSQSLVIPRSYCPNCKTTIPFWHNIPLLSYFILRGKCHNCYTKISLRYPTVELICCLASIVAVMHFELSWQTCAFLPLTWALIAMTFIDIDHLILPDIITLPFLWLGLLLSLFGIFVPPASAILGAISGYLIFWLIAKIFEKIRHKEGMGHGDFKLLAMFGAWAGWHMLPLIILFASLSGLAVGLSLILFKNRSFHKPIPFGPFIALAGWIVMMLGGDIYNWYFSIIRCF